MLKTLSITAFLTALIAANTLAKTFPRGIMALPASISASKPIGTIDQHPWQNANVDGLRIRTGWSNTEPSDGIFNWVQIDECLALAKVSGKVIGLSVVSGVDAPPWLMGGVTFSDGTTVAGIPTLTSVTAGFTTADVGRVIVSSNFPQGTKISSRISSSMVRTSVSASKSSTDKTAATFSILARNSGGAAFTVLAAPDSGVMVVPWDPIAKEQFKAFIVAQGAKYDANARVAYIAMTGFCQTGEAYLAKSQTDINFFNASAIAAGYNDSPTLPAGLVAWEATVKEIVGTYMAAFPNTPLLITGARPYGGPQQTVGTTAMNDIFAWGVATYPGRFGIMNSQLHATSTTGYFLNAAIFNNHLTQPTGIQFLCSTSTPDGIARMSNAPPWGSDPLLSGYDALNTSLTAGVDLGCGYIEVYEWDITNPPYQTMLATQRARLLNL